MKIRLAMLVLASALTSAPAYAQSCAICAKSAAAADPAGQRAMNRAIALLFIPPVAILGTILGVAFRYKNR
jgi:hypothetical protein